MSHLPVSRFPEFGLLRGAELFAGPFAAVGGEAIEVARRAAGGGSVFPASFEPAGFVEAHEDRVERAGSKAGGLAEGVTVMPVGGLDEESLEEMEGLVREA